ncbi:hypothetical protein C6575_27720, partial [Nocardia seriolae]
MAGHRRRPRPRRHPGRPPRSPHRRRHRPLPPPPEIVCRSEDIPLEYALAAAGPARRTLAAVLTPLADHPLLTETLEALISHQLNTSAVARTLHVHRNTVNYRLARIADLILQRHLCESVLVDLLCGVGSCCGRVGFVDESDRG